MSALILAHLIESYGPRMTMPQVAHALGMKEATLRNRLSARSISLPTYLDGGLRFADARDVAAYLDECRQAARRKHSESASPA